MENSLNLGMMTRDDAMIVARALEGAGGARERQLAQRFRKHASDCLFKMAGVGR